MPKPDLLKGVSQISAFLRGEIGIEDADLRRTYYLCETKQIPAGKLGGRWIASREQIRLRIAELVSGRSTAVAADEQSPPRLSAAGSRQRVA
jgi:hypothetical protein